jgi:hypothetical protein
MLRYALMICLALTQTVSGDDSNQLKPVLATPGKVHLQMDFARDFTVKKGHGFFVCGQGTTWVANDGMLVGTQSSPEYQAKKKQQGNGHLGTAPRLQFPNSPKDVILKYSFKIVGGKKTKLLPIIEAGHHLRRIYFGSAGSQILVDRRKRFHLADRHVVPRDAGDQGQRISDSISEWSDTVRQPSRSRSRVCELQHRYHSDRQRYDLHRQYDNLARGRCSAVMGRNEEDTGSEIERHGHENVCCM